MTSAVFPKCKKKWATGSGPDLDLDDIRVMLVASTYAYDAADEFVADLGAVDNGRSAALGAVAVDDAAIVDANDSSLTATAAVACNALIMFKHTGNNATAELIAYIDDVVGLPFTPEAAQVCPLVWDNGANKIVKL